MGDDEIRRSDAEAIRQLRDQPIEGFKGHDPETGEPLTDLSVDELWAYLFTSPEDNVEGIAAVHGTDGWTPMVGADEERMRMLRPAAEALARFLSLEVKLVRFSHREDVETITGRLVE